MGNATSETPIDFRTAPDRYRHWKLSTENGVAYLTMDVNEDGGLRPGYKLKLNSYDLGVDIELADAVQRLRFEHPEVGAVVIRSLRDRIFCSGANINMLGLSQPRSQGELLQVHQRDAACHRGRQRAFGPDLHLLDQRHRRRRRLRAGAGLRSDPAGRRRLERGVAARAAVARRAARHRRPHAPGRQAPGAARPRRLLLHHRRGRARQAGARLAPGRQADPAQQACRRDEEDRRGRRRQVEPAQRRQGHRPARRRARDRGRHDPLRLAHHRDRPRAPRREVPRKGSGRRAAGRCRCRPRPGCRLLAAGAGARARRRHDASAAQRDRDRHLGAAEPGRCRPGRGL